MIINAYIDDATHMRLLKLASETGRTIDDLAECAIIEAALDAFRRRDDDPARVPKGSHQS